MYLKLSVETFYATECMMTQLRSDVWNSWIVFFSTGSLKRAIQKNRFAEVSRTSHHLHYTECSRWSSGYLTLIPVSTPAFTSQPNVEFRRQFPARSVFVCGSTICWLLKWLCCRVRIISVRSKAHIHTSRVVFVFGLRICAAEPTIFRFNGWVNTCLW